MADLEGEAEESSVLSRLSIITNNDSINKISLVNGDPESEITLEMLKNAIEISKQRVENKVNRYRSNKLIYIYMCLYMIAFIYWFIDRSFSLSIVNSFGGKCHYFKICNSHTSISNSVFNSIKDCCPKRKSNDNNNKKNLFQIL